MTMSKPVSYDHGARVAERARQNNAWSEPAASVEPARNTVEPMREAVIILPCYDNRNNPTTYAHAMLADGLMEDFGGFTEQNVTGRWKDADTGREYRDASILYTVAASANESNWKRFEARAIQACKDAEQIALYVRGFDGIARLVKLT